MGKSEKMYKNTPKMERGDEDGKMKISKGEKETARENDDTASIATEDGVAPNMRHAMERTMMHHRHETEHTMHDNGKTGDKKEMHSRHIKEITDMQKRHEKGKTSK